MDGHGPQPWLYDPASSAAVVRAHRPAGGGASTCVVSDVLWTEVLALVRWASATPAAPRELRSGTAWRTTASAGLLRRLPALCDELVARLLAPGDATPLCVLAVAGGAGDPDAGGERLGVGRPGDRAALVRDRPGTLPRWRSYPATWRCSPLRGARRVAVAGAAPTRPARRGGRGGRGGGRGAEVGAAAGPRRLAGGRGSQRGPARYWPGRRRSSRSVPGFRGARPGRGGA